jgi:hypothetical protein
LNRSVVEIFNISETNKQWFCCLQSHNPKAPQVSQAVKQISIDSFIREKPGKDGLIIPTSAAVFSFVFLILPFHWLSKYCQSK